MSRTLVKSAHRKTNVLISQPKHVVGTQKNRLNAAHLQNFTIASLDDQMSLDKLIQINKSYYNLLNSEL